MLTEKLTRQGVRDLNHLGKLKRQSRVYTIEYTDPDLKRPVSKQFTNPSKLMEHLSELYDRGVLKNFKKIR